MKSVVTDTTSISRKNGKTRLKDCREKKRETNATSNKMNKSSEKFISGIISVAQPKVTMMYCICLVPTLHQLSFHFSMVRL